MTTPPAPLTVGDALGNAGPLPTVPFRGKSIPVGRPCPATIARVELQVAADAYAALDALKKVLPADTYEGRLDALDRRVLDRREHAAGEPMFNAIWSSKAGFRLLLWSCIAEANPLFAVADAEELMRDHPREAMRTVGMVCGNFFRALADQAGADPTLFDPIVAGLAATAKEMEAKEAAKELREAEAKGETGG